MIMAISHQVLNTVFEVSVDRPHALRNNHSSLDGLLLRNTSFLITLTHVSTGAGDPHIHPVSRSRLYEQVAKKIVRWMTESDLQPGDRLPPERELAARLGVSRATISQALVAMEVVGVVSVRQGDGVIVTDAAAEAQLVDGIGANNQRMPDIL